jgi:transposase-like protein
MEFIKKPMASSEKADNKANKTAKAGAPAPRKRGRPKGSSNKVKKGKAGRPPKAAKAAMASKAPKAGKAGGRKKGNTGKRYSPEQKAEIVAFVNSRGRGGISEACKKFKVSYIALRRWLEGAGVTAGNSKKAGRPAGGDKRAAATLKKAAAEAKALRKQITALHRLLRTLA